MISFYHSDQDLRQPAGADIIRPRGSLGSFLQTGG